MNRNDFIELLIEKSYSVHKDDDAGAIDFPRRLITTVLDYAEELGMAGPKLDDIYEDGRIRKRGWD